MMATLAIFTAFAEEGEMGKWKKSFTPVVNEDDMGGVCLAQAPDGSVYVASKQSKDFSFAGTTAQASEISGSSVIVKYDAEGTEVWSTPLLGNATVTYMKVDEDGALYVAGTFTGSVHYYLGGNDGIQFMTSDDVFSAFVGKVNADGGGFDRMKVLTPTPDTSVTENFEDGYFYWSEEPISITPNNIQIDGDKVYVSAKYYGDVQELGWKGAYVNSDGLAADVASYGVFSLSKSDLSSPASVATLRQTEEVPSTGMSQPEAFNFAVMDGTLFVGFFAYGNVTLTTAAAGSKSFSYERGDAESGLKEHALVLAMTLGSSLISKEYKTAEMHANEALGIYNILPPVMQDGTLFVAGSFFGNFPLDTNITNNAITTFLVSYSPLQNQFNWINTTADVEGNVQPVAMVVTGDEIHVATDQCIMTIETESGHKEYEDMVVAAGDAYDDTYASIAMVDATTVNVIMMNMNEEGGGDGDTFGDWTRSLKPIAEGDNDDLKGLHTAVTLDGDVYASMTYNVPLQFGGKQLPDPEGLVSAMACKYNNKGEELWAVSFSGAVITDMTTDVDNNLYVVGTYRDDMKVVSTAGDDGYIQAAGGGTNAFLYKITPEGKIVDGHNYYSKAPAWMGEDEYWDTPRVIPNHVVVYGGKVYVGVTYTGELLQFGWNGTYLNYYYTGYMENPSVGIFWESTDFTSYGSLATLQATESLIDIDGHGARVDDYNFVFDKDANLNVAFIGWGNLTLTYGADKTDFSFGFGEEGTGMREHGFVLCKFGSTISSACIHAEMNDNEYPTYDICSMMAEDDKIYMAGTFFGNLWFNPSITVAKNTSFVVASAIKGYDLWYSTGSEDGESYGTAMNFEGGNLMVSTTEGTDLMDVNSWTIMEGKHQSATLADLAGIKSAVNGYIYRSGHKVYVSGRYKAEEAAKVATGIKQTEAPAKAKATGTRYNVAGQQVNAAYKGFYIQDGKKKYSK